MMSKMCEELKVKIVAGIAAYNAAMAANDAKAMAAAENEIKENEKEYASQSQSDLFSECKTAENPILAVIKVGFFDVLKHEFNRQDGKITGMALANGEKQIDLKRLFSYYQKPDLWKYKIERLGELLCERTAADIEAATATQIRQTYKMSEKGKDCKLECNPTSNTSLLKALQTIIDEILFEDDGKGKNVHRANNRDVKYLLNCFTSRGGKLTVKCANNNTLTRLIAEIMYRITNGYAYGVKYKMVESDTTLEAQRAANLQAKEAKAEKAEVSDDVVVSRPNESEDAA